jgi:carbamoyl-phosphate synthase large subunit
MRTARVLCTSAGNAGFPAVLDALRQRPGTFILAVDADPAAACLALADVGAVVPRRTDPTALGLTLSALISAHHIDVVLPLSTEDQPFFAAHRGTLERLGAVVAVAPEPAVRLANDKHALYRHCAAAGFPVPTFVITASRDEMLATLASYRARGRRCVIKRSHGTGAQGVKVVDPDISCATRFWSRDNIVLSYDDVIAWVQEQDDVCPLLISDYLPGEHLSVDAFIGLRGEFVAVIRSESHHVYGMGTFGRTLMEPALAQMTRMIAEGVGLQYAFNVEFRRDADGVPHLLEINPRFAASIGHSIAAGVNFPLLVVDSARGVPVEVPRPMAGVDFRRYWTHTTGALRTP